MTRVLGLTEYAENVEDVRAAKRPGGGRTDEGAKRPLTGPINRCDEQYQIEIDRLH